MHEQTTTARNAHQAYMLGLCASSLAVREAQAAGITDKLTLNVIGMNAGWTAMETVGCERPPLVAAQINAFYDSATAPIAGV